MKRQPKGWGERFDDSLEANPSPALEDWRWSREGEGAVDPRVVSAALDLVTLQASAEAAKLHHIQRQCEGEMAKTFFPALVVAGARWTDVGAMVVRDVEGREYWPRDLAFVAGREHLEPQLTIACAVELGRNVVDFLLTYAHTEHLTIDGDLHAVQETRTMVVLLGDEARGRKDAAERRAREIELQQEDHLVVRFTRSELWRDVVGSADEALRTLVQSTRFDVEQRVVAMQRP